jgi:hypothetical protein
MSVRSEAHVIPASVGGELSVFCLCKRCNNEMGRMEALLAKDISVRRHVKYALRSRLPAKLRDAILKGEQYFADHEEYGRVFAVVDESGELQPRQSTTVKDDEHTLAQALAELDRVGASDERRAELCDQFERAEPGAWIEVRPGYRIQRLLDWTDVSFRESLNDPMVGHEVPLGIAYLYLALCLGERVYDTALAPVRKALTNAIEGDTRNAYELLPRDRRMGTDKVEPIHLLRARNDADGVIVTLQIFRDLAWPVRFPNVSLHGKQTLYRMDVERNEEWWATRLVAG